jgi:hypothetical protein
MSDDKDRRRFNKSYSTSYSLATENDVWLLGFAGQPWQLVDHEVGRTPRARGVDPYNSADQHPRKLPWLHIERR